MSRRSVRATAQPQSLADEQATHRYHAQDLLDLRRVLQQSVQPGEDSDSDEDPPGVDGYSSSEEEEDEKENIPPDSAWTRETHSITIHDFIMPYGSNLPRHCVRSEMGYLQCFLTPALVSTIAANTNLYAQFKQASAGWSTSAEELWLFIAVRIFMGIVALPSLHMYWAARWKQQYVTSVFPRARFEELLRYFHIAPPTPPDVRHTVIQKIAPLYDHCRRVFPSYFTPPREFAVDETMVGFKGRSAWKTVIKGKPTPIGYKVYTVASHGYLLNFDIYKGKVVIPRHRESSLTLL
jgi:Transposase IS4